MMSSSDEFDIPRPRVDGKGRGLRKTLTDARTYIRNSGEASDSIALELGSKFGGGRSSGAKPSRKKRKTKVHIQTWKVVPVCLQKPDENTVPKMGSLSKLCRIGLGSKWFTVDDRLEIELHLSAEELHLLILCLYPQLKGIPYEFCKAAGPGNTVIVPILIPEERKRPRQGKPFHPYFSSSVLREKVGRKGKLYIRPLKNIQTSRSLSDVEVFTPRKDVPCVHCSLLVCLEDIPAHLYDCTFRQQSGIDLSRDPRTPRGSSPPRSHQLSTDAQGSRARLSSSPQTYEPTAEDQGSRASPLLSSSPPWTRADQDEHQVDDPLLSSIPLWAHGPSADAQAGPLLSSTPRGHSDVTSEALGMRRALIRQQDEAYEESLQADQAKERAHASVELEDIRQTRIETWYQRIREDLRESLRPEPPANTAGVVTVRIRFPNGESVCRKFYQTDDIQVLRSFVASHEVVNPRHFRLLVDYPNWRALGCQGYLSEMGVRTSSVITVENTPVERESSPEERQSSPLLSYASVSSEMIDLTQTSDKEMQKMNQLRMELREKLVDNGIHQLDVGRVSVYDDLLRAYENDPTIVEKDIRVKFRGERGVDAGGLSRELFPAFWESACTQVFDGRIEKIPVLTPDNAEVFHLLGLILSHGFVLTGFFPMYFVKTMTNTLVCNEETNNDQLYQSFLEYIDLSESRAVSTCYEKPDPSLFKHIIPMLSRFSCTRNPSLSNFRKIILSTARFALICQPWYAIHEMRRGMMKSFPELWQEFDTSIIKELNDNLKPTAEKVWALIEEPELVCSSESRVLDFFRRFIFSLSADKLASLLRFITGSPQCSVQRIEVGFCVATSEFTRRPTASTCGMMIHLPTNYTTYTNFEQEFNSVLANYNHWYFDGL